MTNISNAGKLLFIKLIHTAIWIVFVSLIFYILYSGISDTITNNVYLAIAAVFGEGLVLLLNKWTCPLTTVARKYTEGNQPDNFDIFLPVWLARQNKNIFTAMYFCGVLIVIWRNLA